MKRNLTAAALALLLVLGLSACGGNDAGEAIVKAQEAMADVQSMTYQTVMEMDLSAEGSSVSMSVTADVSAIVDPLALEMAMSLDMGELGTLDYTSYMVSGDDALTMYSCLDMGDGPTWIREDVTDMTSLSQYDAKASLDLYLKSAQSFREVGAETVGDYEAVRYDGVIKGDDLDEVLETSGVLEQLSNLGIEESADLLTDIGDLPISIWIDQATSFPVKYEMDMSDLMQTMLGKMAETDESVSGITVDKLIVSMVVTGVDCVDEIVVPEEALTATSEG